MKTIFDLKSYSDLLAYEHRGVSIAQSASSITNACCEWRPGDLDSNCEQGPFAGISLKLSTLDNHAVALSLTAKMPDGEYHLYGFHHDQKGKMALMEAQPIQVKDYVYLEIALQPKTGNVIFWINDTGLDVGKLAGFDTGAQKVTWEGNVTKPLMRLVSGQMTRCAYATNSSWVATSFDQSHIDRFWAKRNDRINIQSPDSLVFGAIKKLA